MLSGIEKDVVDEIKNINKQLRSIEEQEIKAILDKVAWLVKRQQLQIEVLEGRLEIRGKALEILAEQFGVTTVDSTIKQAAEEVLKDEV